MVSRPRTAKSSRMGSGLGTQDAASFRMACGWPSTGVGRNIRLSCPLQCCAAPAREGFHAHVTGCRGGIDGGGVVCCLAQEVSHCLKCSPRGLPRGRVEWAYSRKGVIASGVLEPKNGGWYGGWNKVAGVSGGVFAEGKF